MNTTELVNPEMIEDEIKLDLLHSIIEYVSTAHMNVEQTRVTCFLRK